MSLRLIFYSLCIVGCLMNGMVDGLWFLIVLMIVMCLIMWILFMVWLVVMSVRGGCLWYIYCRVKMDWLLL